MAELTYLDNVTRNPNSVVTVGTFDGVHLGHRTLIKKVIKKAVERDARSVIVTFDPHPREIINSSTDSIKLLTTLQERCEILEDMGVDLMVVIPFDRDFSLLTSDQFIESIICKKIGVSEFVIGYDHHFGKDREGSIETVKVLGNRLEFEVTVVSKQEVANTTVSSTKIRETISEVGNMKLAAKLLGRYYLLNGTVIRGDNRGKSIGYPTANIKPEHSRKIIPEDGVYAVKVRVDDTWHGGMMNIGKRPTFKDDLRTLEVHIFNFDQDIYGKPIQIRFIERLRDEIKFDGLEELKSQLEKDRLNALSVLRDT